jgi:tripartite-type tricarboxylate transporter receptor subunit TctC
MEAGMISRRTFLCTTLATAALLAVHTALAQGAWPERPVRIIVPFSAGGASDVLTRMLAEQLHAKLGQTFIVENLTGAGGNIGMDAVAKAAPDGYTIASATIGTLSINQFLFARMPYDPERDFAYVSLIWENCNVVVVPAEHNRAKTLQEFLSWAKARPHGVSFSSAGIGTTPHLSGELFRLRTDIKATHVPYRGAAQSIPGLLSGNVDFAIDNVASYMPFLRSGKVRALAVTSAERWPTVPEIPTMAEAGVKDFIVTSWGAFVMPAATPPAIVNKLSGTIQAIAKEAPFQERFMNAGARAISSTPQEAAAFAAQERKKWSEVVRVSGAKVE